ncbi:DUF547 domain-containing protein [Fretibacter rubidus]|uniref:DUF547 domain-containing protein n=1 Tax=Fretibacter rubidus TaxID=570162 RepID=UPI00352B6E97
MRTRFFKTSSVLVLGAALSLFVPSLTTPSYAQTVNPQMSAGVMINGYTPKAKPTPLAQFAPQAFTSRTRLDYSVLDEALDNSVLRFGASTRRYLGKPQGATGTRFIRGHRSAYRLEGSRVSFSFLGDEYRQAIIDYRADLERIGNQINLVNMSRDEQLAFWLNLHNVKLIEQIALQYPVRRPSRMTVNGVPLHDAKLLNIKGTPLSLRDIRERIVFPNWTNPETIYGFFYGDIGSPGLQDYAYKASNVNAVLSLQASEFVNSLRGFNETSGAREVSRLYAEAQPFYFPNWERDLDAHLMKHAAEEVRVELASGKPFKIDRYDDVIADLMGGDRPRIATGDVRDLDSGTPLDSMQLPNEVQRLIRELSQKREVLRRRGLLSSGTVVIEDIETPSVQAFDPNVDPASDTYVPPNQ